MLKELIIDDIEAFAVGSCILVTGGGGNPYRILLNMRELYRKGYKVNLINPKYLNDNDSVGVLSNMGAPLVGEERLSDPEFAKKPVLIMESYLGSKFDALMPLEIGGANGLQPFLVGALTGQPVVDADQMGRAYPEAQMTSVAVNNLKCFPLTMADIRDNEIIIKKADNWRWMERISRKICTEIGSIAATCKAPRTGLEVKKYCIRNTVSKALKLGKAVKKAQKEKTDPIEAIIKVTKGLRVFSGKVVDVNRRTTGGFLKGQITINGKKKHENLILHFQNEFSLGIIKDKPIVMTPDLICVLDSYTGEAIGTDTIRYGHKIDILALPAPKVFLSTEGLKAVGPKAFGFDIEFKSIFKNE